MLVFSIDILLLLIKKKKKNSHKGFRNILGGTFLFQMFSLRLEEFSEYIPITKQKVSSHLFPDVEVQRQGHRSFGQEKALFLQNFLGDFLIP